MSSGGVTTESIFCETSALWRMTTAHFLYLTASFHKKETTTEYGSQLDEEKPTPPPDHFTQASSLGQPSQRPVSTLTLHYK